MAVRTFAQRVLIEHRRAQLEAMQRGFNFLPGWSLLLEVFSAKERRQLVSGIEHILAADVCVVLSPIGAFNVSGGEASGCSQSSTSILEHHQLQSPSADNNCSSSPGECKFNHPVVACLVSALNRFEAEDKATAASCTSLGTPPSLLRSFLQFVTGQTAITTSTCIQVAPLELASNKSMDPVAAEAAKVFPEAYTCVPELRLPALVDVDIMCSRLKEAIHSRNRAMGDRN